MNAITVLVSMDGSRERVRLESGSSVEDLIRSMGLLPDTLLTLMDDRPVPITLPLEEGCEVRLLRVASGG